MEFITCYYGSHTKGCWKRLKYLLNYIAKQGNRVHLFSHKYPGSHINGIFHHEIPLKANSPLSPIHFIISAKKVFKEHKIELSNSTFFAFDLHNAYLLNRITKTTLRTVFVRGLPKYHTKMNNLTSQERAFIEYASSRGIRATEQLIFNSYASAEDFCATYGDIRHFDVLYNNVPTSETFPIVSNVDSRIRIGFIGQFITRKNPLFIVNSLHSLFAERNLHLLYKGDGELLSELQKYVVDHKLQEYVEFEDWGDNTKQFYQKIDILIVPSLYDECPNVILEAFAHNVAVLGSWAGGIPELLSFNERLLFSITDDGSSLKKKFSDITSSPKELARVKAMCKSYAEFYDFDWGAKALKAILS